MKKTEKAIQYTEIQSHILNNIYDKLEADMRKNITKISSLGRRENRIEIYYSPTGYGQMTGIEDKTHKNSSKQKRESKKCDMVILEVEVNAKGHVAICSLGPVDKHMDTTMSDSLEVMCQYISHACDLDENQLEQMTSIYLEETSSLTFFRSKKDEKENENRTLLKQDNEKTRQNRCCDII